MYKQPRRDFDLCGYSFPNEKLFISENDDDTGIPVFQLIQLIKQTFSLLGSKLLYNVLTTQGNHW